MFCVPGQPAAWQCPHCGYTTPVLGPQALATLSHMSSNAPPPTAADLAIPMDVETGTPQKTFVGWPLPNKDGTFVSASTVGLDVPAMVLAICGGFVAFLVVSVFTFAFVGIMAASVAGATLYFLRAQRSTVFPGRVLPTYAHALAPGMWILRDSGNSLWQQGMTNAYAVLVVSVWAEPGGAVVITYSGSTDQERLNAGSIVTTIRPPSEGQWFPPE